jgi:predicted ATP-grasp superfamily ATP-dependent carboligase
LGKVLVTNASDRAALAVIRSLGKRGVDVIAAESFSFSTGALSKYCRHRILYPPPERNKTTFIKWLLHFVKRENLDLLIPVNDFTALPISEYKDDFQKYVKVATPKYEVAMRAFDKIQTFRIATEQGIPTPKTYVIDGQEDVARLAKELSYPIVVKPRMKVRWVNERAIIQKITLRNYAYNQTDLINKYSEISASMKNSGIEDDLAFLQECIRGDAFGAEALMSKQGPRALFAHKRLREYPVTGGASTLRESVRAEKVLELGVQLLKSMEWTGVAMVEFKVDEKDNQPKLIEVNGRIWGSLALAINAGIDFPYLLYCFIVKEEDPSPTPYRIGIKQRWLLPGDILWLLSSVISSSNKIVPIEDFLKAFAAKDDVISLADPGPLFGAVVDMLKDAKDVIARRRSIEGETIMPRPRRFVV